MVKDSSFYEYNKDEQKAILAAKPWKNDPNYFTGVKISTIALLRMAMHARSGGAIEVMGVMTGKIVGREFVIMDAYPLPVEGTETRVNAMGEGLEYMVQYLESLHAVDRPENVVGWYHSHPGYGCWLSGIDVGTQFQNQSFQDPFVAIVVDPNQTVAAGKVEIGAFRTYPKDYVPNDSKAKGRSGDGSSGGDAGIPLTKLEEFGAHADRYYPLDVSYFKGEADKALLNVLWNRYWSTTLAQSGLTVNYEYTNSKIEDAARKTKMLADKKKRKDGSLEAAYSKGRDLTERGAALLNMLSAINDHGKFARGTTKPHTMATRKSANSALNSKSMKQEASWYQGGVEIGSTEVQGLLSRELKLSVLEATFP